MKLSCHEMMLGERPLAEKFRLAQAAGFDGLDLRGDLLHDRVDEARRLVNATGLDVPTIYGRVTTPLVSRTLRERAESLEIVRGRLADAAAVGARQVIVVPIFGAARLTMQRGQGVEEVEEALLLALLDELAADAAQAQVTIVLEPLNHNQTHLLTSPAHAAALTSHLDGWVGTMIDFFHLDIEGQDATAEITATGDQLRLVHLSDRQRKLPGTGGIDFAPGLRALQAAGYTSYCGFECTGPFDVPELQASIQYVRDCLA